MTCLSRRFYGVAAGAGISYSNFAVALPLYLIATGNSATLVGELLALNTIGFSFGAAAAGLLGRRRGAGTILAVGVAAIAAGDLLLMLLGSVEFLALGGLLNGIGMGLFWVGTQGILGRAAGGTGSERAFVRQYVLYIVGSAAGAALTGVAIALLRGLGVAPALSIRLTFGIGMVAALVALVGWLPYRQAAGRTDVIAEPTPSLPLQGFALQLPDLLLVLAAAMLLNLAPVLLKNSFGLSPLVIGLIIGGIALAKITGSLAAGRAVRAQGSRRAIFVMLAGAALLTLALPAAHIAPLFVTLLLATTVLAVGAWPVIVDAALARVAPERRVGLAVVWNVREYAVIAGGTALGGWLLDISGTPTVALLIAALSLTASAAAAARVLRGPVYTPEAVT